MSLPYTSTHLATQITSLAAVPSQDEFDVEADERWFRRELLALYLPEVRMTIAQAWESLNGYIREMRSDAEHAKERTAQMAQVSLALWRAGIEYVQTTAGWPCRYEGWLYLSNPDLGGMNFELLAEQRPPMGLVILRM